MCAQWCVPAIQEVGSRPDRHQGHFPQLVYRAASAPVSGFVRGILRTVFALCLRGVCSYVIAFVWVGAGGSVGGSGCECGCECGWQRV